MVVCVCILQFSYREDILVHVARIKEHICDELIAYHYPLLECFFDCEYTVLHRIVLHHDIAVAIVATIWDAKWNFHKIRDVLNIVLLESMLRV